MANRPVIMPRVTHKPVVENLTQNVQLTKPISQINAGSPSQFPITEDSFKIIEMEYQTPDLENIQEYYRLLNKVTTNGSATFQDLEKLQRLANEIKQYVLTDEDYNLMVGSIREMEAYILRFMYRDISAKAAAMDDALEIAINEFNTFMEQLEIVYSESPGNMTNNYPIPDNSVLRKKLEPGVRETLDYTDLTQSIVVSTVKPANPEGRSFTWFNTGPKI